MIRFVQVLLLATLLSLVGCATLERWMGPPLPEPIRIANSSADGSYLELSNGSVWRPDPGYRARSSEWQIGDAVEVSPASLGPPWWQLENQQSAQIVIAQAPRMVAPGSMPSEPEPSDPQWLIPNWLRR